MSRQTKVLRLPTAGPQDTSPLAAAIEAGELDPATIVAIVGKTEGNGCVNDFTRGYATLALKLVLASALGCAVAEIEKRVASTSAGVELLRNEIVVLGNAHGWSGDLLIDHDVMRDAIDAGAAHRILGRLGVTGEDVAAVLAKAEASPSGAIRGRRHTMLDDSDIHSTRHARALVGGVLAGVVGDTMLYVSGGAEHQGPAGGGPIAIIGRV